MTPMGCCFPHRIRTSLLKLRPIPEEEGFEKEALSSDLLPAHPHRQALRNKGPTGQGPHVSAHLHDEAGLLNQQRTMAVALGALSLYSLDVLVVVRAQDLMQIRMRATLPGDTK